MRDVNSRIQIPFGNLNRTIDFVPGVTRIITVLVLLCVTSPTGIAGQSAPASVEKSSAIEAHFSAAQQAQRPMLVEQREVPRAAQVGTQESLERRRPAWQQPAVGRADAAARRPLPSAE